MGSRVVPSAALVGFAIPDSRINRDTLQTTSSYTQAGPHPGSAVPSDSLSELQVQLCGEQSDEYIATLTSAGMPVLNKGARAKIRKTSEAAAKDRGHNPPNLLTGWIATEYSTAASATYSQPAAVTIPSSQLVAVVYGQVAGGATGYCRTWNPFTATWSSAATISADGGTNHIWAVCCLPGSERLLAMLNKQSSIDTGDLYYSDDDGVTWALWAAAPLDTAMAITTRYRARMYAVGDDLLYVIMGDEAGTTHLHQFASSTRGASFAEVEDWSAPCAATIMPDIVPLSDNRVGIVTINSGTNRPQWRVVSSVWDPFSGATAADISTQTVSEVATFVDPAGAVWVYGRSSGSWYVWRSDDNGTTWKASTVGLVATADAATYPTSLAPVAAAGAACIAHQWAAAPSTRDLSIAMLTAGGWSNLTTDVTHTSATPIADLDSERCGFGPQAVSGMTTITWLPFDVPTDNTWTNAGAGGTETLVTPGYVELSTAANTIYYTPPAAISTATSFFGIFELLVVSGGALATSDVAIRLDITDGTATSGCSIAVRFTTTGFRIRDLVAGTDTSIVIDCTSALQVAIGFTHPSGVDLPGTLDIVYRRPGGTTWTTAISSTAIDSDVGITAGLFEWGNIAAATAVSRWRMVAVSYGFPSGGWDYAGSGSSVHDDVFGRVITGRPYPLGDTATSGATFIYAKDGPARVAETHTITPTYDHGVERIFYDLSPSLVEDWRSTSTAENTFVFNPSYIGTTTDTSPHSRSIVVGFFGCNFQTAYLEGDTGAGYVTIGIYDAAVDFTGLTAAVDGDQVTPGATAVALRYLQRGELVGSTFRDNAGTYAKILHNEEGGWTTSTTRVPRLTVDRAVVAGGTGARIICKNGLLVCHAITENYRSYRIRIPTQSTADSDLRAAAIVVCGLVVPGLPWEWGWTEGLEPTVTAEQSRRGTTRITEEGPPRRILSFGWANGIPLRRLRAGLDNDYITAHSGHAVGTAIGTSRDVPWLMQGVMRECKSGQIPVIALKVVPEVATYTSVTDPSHYVYGRMESTIQQAHVTGKTGYSEYIRMETISVRELL